ncbi:MAG: hypothetical protein JSV88_05680 [Candidatus Aminicenantes bacterium]|nr:MAG: hypothetical protein JSV88_05680 [Candidatus Aminicenantes bacterium]
MLKEVCHWEVLERTVIGHWRETGSQEIFACHENKPRRHAKGREEKMVINTIVDASRFDSSNPVEMRMNRPGQGLINQAVTHLQ